MKLYVNFQKNEPAIGMGQSLVYRFLVSFIGFGFCLNLGACTSNQDEAATAAVPATTEAGKYSVPQREITQEGTLELLPEDLVSGKKEEHLNIMINLYPSHQSLAKLAKENRQEVLTKTAIKEFAELRKNDKWKDLNGALVEFISLTGYNEYGKLDFKTMKNHGLVQLKKVGEEIIVEENKLTEELL